MANTIGFVSCGSGAEPNIVYKMAQEKGIKSYVLSHGELFELNGSHDNIKRAQFDRSIISFCKDRSKESKDDQSKSLEESYLQFIGKRASSVRFNPNIDGLTDVARCVHLDTHKVALKSNNQYRQDFEPHHKMTEERKRPETDKKPAQSISRRPSSPEENIAKILEGRDWSDNVHE